MPSAVFSDVDCVCAPGFPSGCIWGRVAEWFKAHAWNACIRESVSRVRIPLCPPFLLIIFGCHPTRSNGDLCPTVAYIGKRRRRLFLHRSSLAGQVVEGAPLPREYTENRWCEGGLSCENIHPLWCRREKITFARSVWLLQFVFAVSVAKEIR